MYREHLVERAREPRGLIWAFIVCAAVFVAILYILFFDSVAFITSSKLLLASRAQAQYGPWIAVLFLFATSCVSFLLALIVSYMFRSDRWSVSGRGFPVVVAYLNGIYLPHLRHGGALAIKYVATLLTRVSSVPMGAFGPIMEMGAMIGTLLTGKGPIMRRIGFVRFFRNPRDARMIGTVGIAVAVSVLFRSPVGGLLFVMELIAQIFPLKFAYLVFSGCMLGVFITQLVITYLNGFDPRHGSDVMVSTTVSLILPAGALRPLAETLQMEFNLLSILPTLVISFLTAFAIVLLTRMGVALIRRRFMTRGRTVFIATCFFAIMIALSAFGFSSRCPSYRAEDTLRQLADYGGADLFCQDTPAATSSSPPPSTTTSGSLSASAEPSSPPSSSPAVPDRGVRYNPLVALFLTDSRTLLKTLTTRDIDFDSVAVLVYLVGVFVVSCFLAASGELSGDEIIPSAIIGASIGRLVGDVTRLTIPVSSDRSWCDSGVFALVGLAGALGGTTRLCYSLVVLLVDFTGDVRHSVILMIAISICKVVNEKFAPVSLTQAFLMEKEYALLDMTQKIERYDKMSVGDVVQGHKLVGLNVKSTVAELFSLLATSTHNGFTVVDAEGHFIGLVLREQIELILWTFTNQVPIDKLYKGRPSGVDRDDLHIMMQSLKRERGGLLSGGEGSISPDRGGRGRGREEAASAGRLAAPLLADSGSLNSTSTEFRSRRQSQDLDGTLSPTRVARDLLISPRASAGGGEAADSNVPITEFVKLRDLDDYVQQQFKGRSATEFLACVRPEDLSLNVNLLRYTDTSSFFLRDFTCLSRAYYLFVVLSARHVVVVDRHHRPTGIITRATLTANHIMDLDASLDRRNLVDQCVPLTDDDEEEEEQGEKRSDGHTAAVAAEEGGGAETLTSTAVGGGSSTERNIMHASFTGRFFASFSARPRGASMFAASGGPAMLRNVESFGQLPPSGSFEQQAARNTSASFASAAGGGGRASAPLLLRNAPAPSRVAGGDFEPPSTRLCQRVSVEPSSHSGGDHKREPEQRDDLHRRSEEGPGAKSTRRALMRTVRPPLFVPWDRVPPELLKHQRRQLALAASQAGGASAPTSTAGGVRVDLFGASVNGGGAIASSSGGMMTPDVPSIALMSDDGCAPAIEMRPVGRSAQDTVE